MQSLDKAMDLQGKVVVLTGKFAEINRAGAEKQLEAMGARCSGSISAKTDMVFAGEGAGSKLAKAASLGIPVFGEADLQAILGGAAPGQAPAQARPTESLEALLTAGRVTFRNDIPHKSELTGWNVSPDGRYFATGGWTSDDEEEGALAIWEVSTGRCVNSVPSIEGGVGGSDEGGVLIWSNDGLRVGISFNTNGVGYVDPFGKATALENGSYPVNTDSPPRWCWAPDSARMFVSCWGYEDAAIPGAIVVPSARKNDPVLMAPTGPDVSAEDAPKLGTFNTMVWREDGIIVGLGNTVAYAIDSQTRKLAWFHQDLATTMALRSDGSLIAFHSGGLKFLDALTGKISAEPNHPGGGDLRFSHDGTWLLEVCHKKNTDKLPESIRVYKGPEFIGAIEVACGATDFYRKDNPQAAFSMDNRYIGAITTSDTLVIFENKPGFQKLCEVPAYAAKNIHCGDGAIILSAKHHLTFYAFDGALIAHHQLDKEPLDDMVTAEIPDPGLMPFAQAETWGYVNAQCVVARTMPDTEVSAVVDRRYAYPITELGLPLFGSFEDAVKAAPKAFSKAIQAAYGKKSAAKSKKTKKLIVANTLSAQDLEDCLFQYLINGKFVCARFVAELAVHRLLNREPEAAMAYADAIVINSGWSCESIAHLAVYFAKEGHPQHALKCLDRAKAGFEIEDYNYAHKNVLSAYFAVAHALLGIESEFSGMLQGDACYPAAKDQASGASAEADKRLIKPVALYRAWTGDIEGAADAINPCGSKTWWQDIASIADAVLAYRDLDRLELFLSRIVDRKHTDHVELLTSTIDLCLQLDPSRALGFLRYFPTLSVAAMEDRIRAHMGQAVVIAQSEAPDFEALLAEAGSDCWALGAVLKQLVEAGDLDRANEVRLKIPKAHRQFASLPLVHALIKSGEYSTALLLLNQLEAEKYSMMGREYELMAGLTVDVWKTVTRIAEVS